MHAQVGDQVKEDIAAGRDFEGGAYMLGKMLWEKGYDRLWDLMTGRTWGRKSLVIPPDSIVMQSTSAVAAAC